MPEHSSTRVTPSGASAVSPMTGWNVPLVKSATGDTQSLCRSNDFGVNTISGLRLADSAWRRSTWKWLAGVDGTTMRMLSSAAICSQRSGRPEVWSGPWPS